MCITFFYINSDKYQGNIRFFLIHNREEDFERKTLPLGPWDEDKNIYGGKDVKAGVNLSIIYIII